LPRNNRISLRPAGTRLPHLDAPGSFQAVTFRLADSLPADVAEKRLALAGPAQRARWAAMLDAGGGECLLRDARAATIVETALLHFDGVRYDLRAWCVMPNHVHVLVRTCAGHPLADVLRAWKSFSALHINRTLGRSGKVWWRNYFDRFIRNEAHLAAVMRYIHHNPVAAGLVAAPEDWPFSSARRLRPDARL